MSALDLPLYHQAQIFARQNVQLDRPTLADWVGWAAWWVTPLRDPLLGHPQNLLFLGSDKGSDRADINYTALQTARLNGVDPEAWLADVLDQLARGCSQLDLYPCLGTGGSRHLSRSPRRSADAYGANPYGDHGGHCCFAVAVPSPWSRPSRPDAATGSRT